MWASRQKIENLESDNALLRQRLDTIEGLMSRVCSDTEYWIDQKIKKEIGVKVNKQCEEEDKDLEKRVADLEWKLDATIRTQRTLWDDYVEHRTKKIIAPLEKSLGYEIWKGFKKDER